MGNQTSKAFQATLLLAVFLYTNAFVTPGSGMAFKAPSVSLQQARMTMDKPDYVILGGGTAGLVLANKLSAEAGNKVLVLEAGGAPDKNLLVKAPAGALKLFQSALDWVFFSHKDPGCHDRDIYLCRGKTLGGSSCVNVMLYHRGDEADYRAWEAAGAEGWGPDAVLPYFKSSQNAREPGMKGAYHGRGGMLDVELPRYQNPLSRMFLAAAEQLGLAGGLTEDFNDWSRPQEGFGRFQVQQRKGRRWHTAMSYLKQALKRPNLETRTGAHITKIQIEDGRAVGVEYVQDNVKKAVRLGEGGEVLLAAGAVGSPHLLQLSGVGDRAELEAKGVPCQVDLPAVGKHLRDHPAANVYFDIAEPVALTDAMFTRDGKRVKPSVMAQWALLGRGPMTCIGCDHGAFVKTRPGLAQADLQIRFLPARGENPDGIATLTEVAREGSKARGLAFQLVACRPKSEGKVSLASANPFDAPEIQTGFLTAEEDVATLREGVRLARQIASQEAFRGMVTGEVFPGADVETDAGLEAYLRQTCHTANALVGTCRMGAAGDAGAVVDPALRVRGVRGLRVVDASVMPTLPGGQTGAPTVMIAERAADLLLQEKRAAGAAAAAAAAPAQAAAGGAPAMA